MSNSTSTRADIPAPSGDASASASTSSAFRDAVVEGLEGKPLPGDTSIGENGCLQWTDKGVGSDILALSQLVRGGVTAQLVQQIIDRGDMTEIIYLFVLIFVTRNTRGGKSEKDLSYDMFLKTWDAYPETAKELLPLFVHYGYWKDLLLMMAKSEGFDMNDEIIDTSLALMKHQWDKDMASMAIYDGKLSAAESAKDEDEIRKIKKEGPKISLLSKWLPREGKEFDKKINFVDKFSKIVYPTSSPGKKNDWQSVAKMKYRKDVTKMTSFLKLPEVLLAAQRADEIEIHRVASKATKILSRAFLNEQKSGEIRSDDAKRMRLRQMFLDTIVERGLKGNQVMPHEIVSAIMKNPNKLSTGMKMSLDAQWKSIWKDVVEQVKAKAEAEGLEFDPTKMVPICDVSGSMAGTPMEVCIALGIGISEITHPAFQNLVMTFSHEPAWFNLSPDDTIVEKVQKLQRAPWGMNTNFEKAYDLILQVCVDKKLSREEMPCLICFSDMQFDQASRSYGYGYGYSSSSKAKDGFMFEHIRSRVKAVAKELGWEDSEPTPIVFWNLRNTGGHPVNKDTEGTVLLAGFSPSLLKLVMNGEALKEEEVEVVQADGTVTTEKIRVTPEQVLLKMLEDSMYDPVRKILAASKEGVLCEYEPNLPDDDDDDKEYGDDEDKDRENDGFEVV